MKQDSTRCYFPALFKFTEKIKVDWTRRR